MPRDDFALLAGAAPEEVQELLSHGRRRTFSAGEVVFHAGDPADCVHFVRGGRFAVRITTEFGDVATLNVVGPGDAFGELALLTPDAPRSATVAALERGETLSVHEIDFRRLRASRPQTDALLTQMLAARVRRLSEQLVDALYLPAETRVRRRLLDVARAYAGADGADGLADGAQVPLTQEELASLAGTSRATVNKVLREEQEQGTIELGRGRTTVRDAAALERRARGFG
ncbi:Crp/Fnr family transcriptional regulator [Conexibacter sp. JD483]|uniref:Crp/Fnr family transcriptional regulator n=1 Tax=unclassified Conexibacter TaxID=2627773 RepID=UPI00271B4943|nr:MULTISPECIES: Crp/Fnr family transcriptional regulator [unclassified Conexibacter]MDO8184870.1 Crp/Fnr family transcriptional regulator [Conexibacter sp. CPCC 205706]MDO8196645.1 Crp/Fnr family transcriptional regulator [Conexibacter sp. CPCC 205762]MDR9371030.1 Crp/Fnr family transcriptional regulator [Conexibacter sp. JD483]